MDIGQLDVNTAASWLHWWERINRVLDLEKRIPDVIPPEVSKLAEDRARAREEKNFAKSDELRDQIAALGWEVRDTKDGQKLTKRTND